MSATLAPVDASSIGAVLDVYRPERAELLDLLRGLGASDWERPTECPVYDVKGIATHILGDDLSLLSRQRDGAVQGLVLMAEKLPGADFRGLLDGFNDQWVEAGRFLSPALLVELLRDSGERTEAFYRAVDPDAPCESVALFAPSDGGLSPYWQAIAREYLERWAHQSQIRRALGQPSLSSEPILAVGIRIVAAAADSVVTTPDTAAGDWCIGPLRLGPTQQAADILTLAHTADEVRSLVEGPADLVEVFAFRTGRRT